MEGLAGMLIFWNGVGLCVYRKEFQQRLGVTIAFVATHSGLTRWQEFPGEETGQV